MRVLSDGELDRPGRVWVVEWDVASCGHQHRTLRAAQECYRRVTRAAMRFERQQPVPDDIVELVGDLTRDRSGGALLGIRGYERARNGEWEWVENGWVSDIWARGEM